MTLALEIQLYNYANDCVKASWEKWERGDYISSLLDTVPARLAYLCDVVATAVIFVFATIALVFGLVLGALSCGQETSLISSSWNCIKKTTNHFYLSIIGSILSPALAHKWKDSDIGLYIVGLRIIAVCVGGGYWYYRQMAR